jgi:rhodanese-related sulfurtransferase
MSIFSQLFGGGPSVDLKSVISEGAFLVDVRTPGEFADGHVKGSVNIPLDNITKEIAQFKNKNNVIVFCRSGNRSGMAKSLLEQQGIKNVINGGTWQNVASFVH